MLLGCIVRNQGGHFFELFYGFFIAVCDGNHEGSLIIFSAGMELGACHDEGGDDGVSVIESGKM